METSLSSGSYFFDEFLEGGYPKGVITMIYGPPGSGKTNLCVLSLLKNTNHDKKAIYLDSEGGFSVIRLNQIVSESNSEEILDNVFFLKPTNFDDQKRDIEKLKHLVDEKIEIIIIDSLSMLYRLELGKGDDEKENNKRLSRELSYQVGILNEIARKKNIPIILTNQIYPNFEKNDSVVLVGGDIIRYHSKVLIELKNGHHGLRKAIIKKHLHVPEGKDLKFRIVEKGIEKVDQQTG